MPSPCGTSTSSVGVVQRRQAISNERGVGRVGKACQGDIGDRLFEAAIPTARRAWKSMEAPMGKAAGQGRMRTSRLS